MRAYTELLVKTCHRRGAHAMGGMAAFIPSRTDAEANERALAKVEADKEREAGDGFDGTWVAHPDFVATALGAVRRGARRPAQPARPAARRRGGRRRRAARRRLGRRPRSPRPGLRNDVNVGIQYISSWLRGNGAAGDLRPDGGRGHGGDRPLAGVAVDAPRTASSRTAPRSRASSSSASRPRSSSASAARSATTSGSCGRAARTARAACSSAWRSATTSSPSSPSPPTRSWRTATTSAWPGA